MKPNVRWMIRRDMQAVLDIEYRSFEFPWSQDDFTQALRQRNCIGMVVEQDERILGYMVYELYAKRISLLSIATAPDALRQGVGRMMIDKLVGKLSPMRRSQIDADVRESNLGAQLFFKACGFIADKVSRDHYENGEDAYQFCYRLDAELQGASHATSVPEER